MDNKIPSREFTVSRSELMSVALAYVAHDGRDLRDAIPEAIRQLTLAHGRFEGESMTEALQETGGSHDIHFGINCKWVGNDLTVRYSGMVIEASKLGVT